MTSPHQPTDLNPLSAESAGEKPSRLLWWLHPKVALPLTLLGKSGELIRLKRDGDDLVIYSVGLNGINDGGNIGDAAGADRNEAPDQGIRAKRPTNSPNPLPTETTPPEKN